MATTDMVALPKSWSNRNRDEKLRRDARDSFSRMIARAVAETGTNFQVYDALRTRAEQIAMFTKHYYNTGRSYKKNRNERWYNGAVWAWRGSVRVASPDLGSNHEDGMAVDLHPGPIQDWVIKNGLRFGWSWDEGKRNKERWHFRYIPSKDQYKAEGYLDHAAVQKVVGATPDGKIGTGTVQKIKDWQKENGLKVDGKVGLDTKRKMGLLGKAEGIQVPTTPSGGTSVPAPTPTDTTKMDGGFRYTYLREDWDTQGVGDRVHPFDTTVKGAYLHYPAAGDVTLADESVEQTMRRLRRYRQDHVERQKWFDIGYQAAFDQRGYSYQLRGANMESGANGGTDSNNEATAFLLLLGDNEKPSKEMIAGVNGFLAQQKDVFPESEYIAGHQESPDASTECPGPEVMANLQNGSFSFKGLPNAKPGTNVGSSKPSTPAKLPTGKALLMAIIDAPDFPLLRTEGHQCYYGSPDGPIESVSGKSENSLNPGDIFNDNGTTRSKGLMTLQRQLNARGYSVDVDGRWGDQMDTAIDNIQRLAGLKRDKKCGPQTWYAVWILPIQ